MSFGGFGVAATSSASTAAQDYDVPPDVPDSISDISWSPTSNVLVAGSWDNYVRCWEVNHQQTQFQAIARAQIQHKAPVLCTAFSADGSTVFSGSCDKTAMMWQLGGPAQGQQIAQHDQPIRSIRFVPTANCVVTGSWDKTVKYWDTRAPQAQATVQLSDRVYALDVSYPLMVVATADKMIHCFDLTKPSQIFTAVKSNLKLQTRCIAAFPDASGFAIGSIEGRVAIQHVDEKQRAERDFAFKAHRDTQNSAVNPVSSVCFHTLPGKMATTGSDGSYTFWDKDARKMLRNFTKVYALQPNYQGISAGKFNAQGDIFAYATSYDWHKGAENYNQQARNVIRLHHVDQTDMTIKTKK
ncbi:WD domain-containing protein [Thraustotheca clavata]|uniref:WD domain-containing protein n=1 Tax=Thraustotheca clavata TaxID=74557 RepID=A0A1V9ZCP5_9STRA|nr:WD domain-containing protein [Thraustotheca clavata]